MGALELGIRADERFEHDPSQPRGSAANPVILDLPLGPSPVTRSRPVPELSEEDVQALARSREYANSLEHRVMAAEARLFDQRRGGGY
jgi:hypothetical protein